MGYTLHELTSPCRRQSIERERACVVHERRGSGISLCLCVACGCARGLCGTACGVHAFGVSAFCQRHRESRSTFIYTKQRQTTPDMVHHSTAHHTTDQGSHIKAISVKPYAPRRTPQHGSTSAPLHPRAACPVGEASSAHPHTRRATGVSRGARPRPWPWPSSCHCPASLVTPVWLGRPPRV